MTTEEKIAFIKTIPESLYTEIIHIPLVIEQLRLKDKDLSRSTSLYLNDVETALRLLFHNPEIFFSFLKKK